MSIIRVTVRTFQSVEHANMFIVMSEKVANDPNNTNLKNQRKSHSKCWPKKSSYEYMGVWWRKTHERS